MSIMFADMMADLHDLATATAWMSWGLCAETDPETFFPDDHVNGSWAEAAISICDGCPIKDECLAYAIDNGITYGVWGGHNVALLQLDEAEPVAA